MNSFQPKVSYYFYTLIILNCKYEITTVPQIYLYNILINFNLLMQYQLFLILDYLNSASSNLEHTRRYQTTQVDESFCCKIKYNNPKTSHKNK